jgi:hypothetical protein
MFKFRARKAHRHLFGAAPTRCMLINMAPGSRSVGYHPAVRGPGPPSLHPSNKPGAANSHSYDAVSAWHAAAFSLNPGRLPVCYASAMDPLHATIEEFAGDGFTTSNAIALDVAWLGSGRSVGCLASRSDSVEVCPALSVV